MWLLIHAGIKVNSLLLLEEWLVACWCFSMVVAETMHAFCSNPIRNPTIWLAESWNHNLHIMVELSIINYYLYKVFKDHMIIFFTFSSDWTTITQLIIMLTLFLWFNIKRNTTTATTTTTTTTNNANINTNNWKGEPVWSIIHIITQQWLVLYQFWPGKWNWYCCLCQLCNFKTYTFFVSIPWFVHETHWDENVFQQINP